MTPWLSDARMGAKGGASSDLARGGSRGSRITRDPAPPSIDAPAKATSRSGTPGSDHVSRLGTCWMPNTVARHVCVVVAASGNDLTLAIRIGRNSARPVEGTIAPFCTAGQMRRKGCWADLCGARRASRFATHTFRCLTPPRVGSGGSVSLEPHSAGSSSRGRLSAMRGHGGASLRGR